MRSCCSGNLSDIISWDISEDYCTAIGQLDD
jgi:hypothetical protein